MSQCSNCLAYGHRASKCPLNQRLSQAFDRFTEFVARICA